jgi:TusA-related sulfurtransferase
MDYKKAFDSAKRSKLLEILADDGTLNQIITAI